MPPRPDRVHPVSWRALTPCHDSMPSPVRRRPNAESRRLATGSSWRSCFPTGAVRLSGPGAAVVGADETGRRGWDARPRPAAPPPPGTKRRLESVRQLVAMVDANGRLRSRSCTRLVSDGIAVNDVAYPRARADVHDVDATATAGLGRPSLTFRWLPLQIDPGSRTQSPPLISAARRTGAGVKALNSEKARRRGGLRRALIVWATLGCRAQVTGTAYGTRRPAHDHSRSRRRSEVRPACRTMEASVPTARVSCNGTITVRVSSSATWRSLQWLPLVATTSKPYFSSAHDVSAGADRKLARAHAERRISIGATIGCCGVWGRGSPSKWSSRASRRLARASSTVLP